MNIEKDIKETEELIQSFVTSYNEKHARLQEIVAEHNKVQAERDEFAIKFREQNAVLEKLKSYVSVSTEEKVSEKK